MSYLPDELDDAFTWLADTVIEFSDKPAAAVIQPTIQSPISSGSSSSNSPSTYDYNDIDTDSDSDVEPLGLSQSYHIINGVAYETNTLPVQDQVDNTPYAPPRSEHRWPLQNEVLLPPLRPRLKRQPSLPSNLSDADADGESDDNASDDEYIPSPILQPLKRRASNPPTYSQPEGNTNFTGLNLPPLATTLRQHPAKRPRPSPSRNAQAIPSTLETSPKSKSNPWSCPHCSWVQRNRRTPDLKRHIRTHMRLLGPAQWVCCGVPLEEAVLHGITDSSEMRLYEGKYFVGGCGKEFSRRDALKRHLDSTGNGCVGKTSAVA